MTKLHELSALGQAAWLDFIRRSYIKSGELSNIVDQGLRGVTSNPTIFEKAITGSDDYDEDLRSLVMHGASVDAIYDALSMADIRLAADALRPVYDQTAGADGYISLEVSPKLAHDRHATIEEACRLSDKLERPNIMIKIPATPAGVEAIRAVIARGVNVNATLIFSREQYEAVAEAYIMGLEAYSQVGDISKIASVASFFVSRVDTAVDRQLELLGERQMLGKTAVANAKVAYERFKEIFSGERWEVLAGKGARAQRPLWASTSTKNPAYPDTLYVDNLIGPDTVNTLPPATLEAFMDHGRVELTLESDLPEAHRHLNRLAELGISLDDVTRKLLDDGVASFADSFDSLLSSIAEVRSGLRAGREQISFKLGEYQASVDITLREIERDRIIERIWNRDFRIWKPEPDEITNRLGWLRVAQAMKSELSRLRALVEDLNREGYTHALLLGMGGSSLAPQVFRKTYGVKDGFLDLSVLDSTDPGAVSALADQLDLEKTLFIVATKSGGTVETLSFFKYFYNRLEEALGAQRAGTHFIAITDPGSKLELIAKELDFRSTFLNDPNIGGRYSALSFFGLLPAALIGVDLSKLLDRAIRAKSGDDLAAKLGAIISELALAGRDKLTLVTSPQINSFGDWVEQLIAESTGKEGKGILPVVGEPLGTPAEYGDDRLFIYLQLAGDHTYDERIGALEAAGNPVVRLRISDLYALGAQFFQWELATAVAGYRLGINPFDQPNVEAAKVLARKMVADYLDQGQLPKLPPALQAHGITVYGEVHTDSLVDAFENFFAGVEPNAYISIQAYVQPTKEMNASLLMLRNKLHAVTRLAVTTGYGPRYLHSTGQLHKGDAGKGLFIQISADAAQDVGIPDQAGSTGSSISFGLLKMAQMLGDRQALLDADRKVITIHLGKDALAGLKVINQVLAELAD